MYCNVFELRVSCITLSKPTFSSVRIKHNNNNNSKSFGTEIEILKSFKRSAHFRCFKDSAIRRVYHGDFSEHVKPSKSPIKSF